MQVKPLVYLDHNATTPVDPRILGELSNWASSWGNPSSIHASGREPKQVLRETRRLMAEMIGAHPLELIFTSGASEANSTVVHSVWAELGKTRPHFITSAVEHPSLMKAFRWLETQGARVDYIPVSRAGVLDLEFLQAKLSQETALVSVMSANNETGTIFPVAEVSRLARTVGALVHTDAVQAIGKIPFSVADVDYASFSAHKIYALKGTGALFSRRGAPLSSLIHGGGQERSRRGGTENTLGIAAFGAALQYVRESMSEAEAMTSIRDHFETRVLAEIPEASVTAKESKRLPGTSSLVLPGVDGETLLMSLDLKGFAVSTGAACSSGNPEPSPVLLAVGLSRQEAQNSLRVSFGRGQSLETADLFVETLKSVVHRLRSLESRSPEVQHGL